MASKYRTLLTAVCLAALTVSAGTVSATSNEHYPLGVEGIKAATLPPPGVYFVNYNVFYTTTSLKSSGGDDLPVGADINLYANAPRLCVITDKQIFGGNYGFDAFFSIYNMDQRIDPSGSSPMRFTESGFGDLFIEPLIISWNRDRWDAVVCAGFFAPTGDFDPVENVPLCRGFWTGMFTVGGTYYLDEEKKTSASILCRYEIHSEQDVTDITPGDDFHFEWGIGTNVNGLEVGVAGYAHWQVTEDSGGASNSNKDRVFAAGPEVAGMIENVPGLERPMFFSARTLWEFEAKDRTEGIKTILTLTIPF